MRVRDYWAHAAEQLEGRRIADAQIEAESLLRCAMGVGRAGFFTLLYDQLDPPRKELSDRLLRRRLAGEPLAYIVGHREFYGLEFVVNPSVLIPRQETELLVDTVLSRYENRPHQEPAIADVGTGSGAIAIAIASRLARGTVYATDSSHAALLVADVNRRRQGVTDRVHLIQSDLLAALRTPVDVIVSNPPYLTEEELNHVQPEIRREPRRALDGGTHGLDVTGRLIREARSHLRPGGLLLVEIAPPQVKAVAEIARKVGRDVEVTFSSDLSGQPRVACIIFPAGASGKTRPPRTPEDRQSANAADETRMPVPG